MSAGEPPTREEFDLLCEVVDIVLTIPGNYEAIRGGLAASGFDVLNRWAAMRLGVTR